MALVTQLPPGTQFYQPVANFSATFNAIDPGFYDFSEPQNISVPFQGIRKERLYLIDRYSFSATVPESAYFEATAGGTIPTLSVKIPKQTKRQIHPDPIPLINFVDGIETLIYTHSAQADTLTATLAGRLTQPAALVGVLTVFAQVQFNIYEIKNIAWIRHFLGLTEKGQAPGLLIPAGP